MNPEEQLQAEAELAKRLSSASEDERRRLYGPTYDRIFGMHLERSPGTFEFGASEGLVPMLRKLSRRGERVLEIGCGMGLLAIRLAEQGRSVVAVDVSKVALDIARERGDGIRWLDFEHVEGVELPFPDRSFHFAYSVEVVEHLHEEDALAHFAEVKRLLRPGGRYWLVTPNRLVGESAGDRFGVESHADADVHLKEWTYRELRRALRQAGFRRIRVPLRDFKHLGWPHMPIGLMTVLERIVPGSRLRDLLGLTRCSVVAS